MRIVQRDAEPIGQRKRGVAGSTHQRCVVHAQVGQGLLQCLQHVIHLVFGHGVECHGTWVEGLQGRQTERAAHAGQRLVHLRCCQAAQIARTGRTPPGRGQLARGIGDDQVGQRRDVGRIKSERHRVQSLTGSQRATRHPDRARQGLSCGVDAPGAVGAGDCL